MLFQCLGLWVLAQAPGQEPLEYKPELERALVQELEQELVRELERALAQDKKQVLESVQKQVQEPVQNLETLAK